MKAKIIHSMQLGLKGCLTFFEVAAVDHANEVTLTPNLTPSSKIKSRWCFEYPFMQTLKLRGAFQCLGSMQYALRVPQTELRCRHKNEGANTSNTDLRLQPSHVNH
jgi:hypothetical protein